MFDVRAELSLLGLRLHAEQEAEVLHYIHQRQRRGLQPDIQELRAMLRDMRDPPIIEEQTNSSEAEGAHADTEHAASLIDDAPDEIGAYEERIALREAETTKHQAH